MHSVNNTQRGVYLDTLGIDRYVSRYQLPGAAISPRPAEHTPDHSPEPVETAPQIPSRQPVPAVAPVVEVKTSGAKHQLSTAENTHSPRPPAGTQALPRFSVAIITAGNWLWVEELDGMPLAREQVQLIQAMAIALDRMAGGDSQTASPARPEVAQFDWPMHDNQQLDQGKAAAGAALVSFIERRLARNLSGLVLLGERISGRVPLEALTCGHVVLPHSSADLLSNAELKQQAWSALKPLRERA